MNYVLAHPTDYDIVITLTFYDMRQQVSRCKFPLRNLSGSTLEAQIDHARQIMDEVATELYYITSIGIDRGVVQVGKKKVAEVLYPELTTLEETLFFLHGVDLSFSAPFTYEWQNGNQRTWTLPPDKLAEGGWDRCKITDKGKKATVRMPVYTNGYNSPLAERIRFFTYGGTIKRGRKKKSWAPDYDQKDTTFTQFITRFHDEGNLCIGEKRYWAQVDHPVEIKGVFWKVPNFAAPKLPRKSAVASLPTDDTEYVYLIRLGRKKVYKIGKTNDPQGRLTSLQTASPYKLKMLHTFKADNASAAEETLHARFHNARMKGEWFSLSDDVREAIGSVTEYRNGRFLVNGKALSLDELFNKE